MCADTVNYFILTNLLLLLMYRKTQPVSKASARVTILKTRIPVGIRCCFVSPEANQSITRL